MVMVIYIVSFIDKIEIIKIDNELAGASTGNILISGRFMIKPTSIIDKLSSDLFCFDKAYTAATILISTLYFGFIKPACTVQRTGRMTRDNPGIPRFIHRREVVFYRPGKLVASRMLDYCCPVFQHGVNLRQRVGGCSKASASRFSGTPV